MTAGIPAGIALPMSPVVAELDKVVSDSLASFPRPAVQSEVETYLMPAAREPTREAKGPPVESRLQDGGELTGELTAAWPAAVPREHQPLHEEAAQKGLYDQHHEFSEVSEEQKSDQTFKSVVKGFGELNLLGRIGHDHENEFEGNVVGNYFASESKAESIENGLDVDPTRDPAIDIELKEKPGEKLAANIEILENVQNAAVVHRSDFSFSGLNHVAFCVESLERSLQFYCDLLGLKTSMDRPDLPYKGAWLFVGAEGIHLMEVPNPDPVNGRPAHGGWDRHACLNCKNVDGVRLALEKQGISYQLSLVPSIFTRDPDGNGLEFIEVDP